MQLAVVDSDDLLIAFHHMKFPLLATAMLMTEISAAPLTYPEAPRADIVETIHGRKIADPYRGLEDLNDKATRTWVEAQAALAQGYLSKLPRRDEIRDRLKKLMDYDRLGLPRTENGRIFFARKTGLQNQSVLYWKASADAAAQVLLDPNLLTKDGTAALSGWSVSQDGKWLAYGISHAGSDWTEWKFREVATGKDTGDHLRWIKFGRPAWNHAGTAVYYSRYAAPTPGQELKHKNDNQKVYVHRLGETQDQDQLFYARPDHPDWSFSCFETDDGAYLLIHIARGTAVENALMYIDLKHGPDAPVVELFSGFDADYSFVGNEGSTFYFVTTKDAPRKRLIAVDLKRPQPAHWRDLVPEQRFLLSGAEYMGGKFIITRLVDAHDEVSVHDGNGKEIQKIPLPGYGSAHGFSGRQTDTQTHYFVAGMTTPGMIYRYDTVTGKSTLSEETKVAFKPGDYETSQVFYPSKDGTKIPMFLCHKRGLVKNGLNPVLLSGYGGFDISLTPAFSASVIAWLDMGGIFAEANLRGGGEYGQEWHDAGRRFKKQNVFDDFIAAAEWLIREKYTQSRKLAISGGSNGGLLVAACMNQRPELFGAVVPAVGVHDMLRYHKFTIGWAWQDEFGKPDDAKAFEYLLGYSPLHNIRRQAYPPTLILTGDHDDRVFPAHSFKYAATLQQHQTGAHPILLRVDLRAGHGAGKPTAKQIEEIADKYAFLAQALEMKP